MPVHNWSRVSDGMFHWFHQRWIGTISDWLNQGRLPEGFYALGELYGHRVFPDLPIVEYRSRDISHKNANSLQGFGISDGELPPQTRFTWQAETENYLAKKDLIAIRNVDGILVAVIEIMSAGNKSSKARLAQFLKKTLNFLDQGIHVLVIDLFPPTSRDPHGIHQVIWSEQYDGEFDFQPDKPLTLASYVASDADSVAECYVEPITFGDPLSSMPLFLLTDRYINIDLEKTYASAWEVYPAPLKSKVERVD